MERFYNYNGDLWSVKEVSPSNIRIRCFSKAAEPDFPVSEIFVGLDQILGNKKIDNNPPHNEQFGGAITMYWATNGLEVLALLMKLMEEGVRIENI